MRLLVTAESTAQADAERAAEDLLAEVAVLDVVLRLGDDVEPVVELLDLAVGLEVVEPAGCVAGDLRRSGR